MSATTLQAPSDARHRPRDLRLASLVGVLGVVYGDIGTSPLYAFKATLALFGSRHVLADHEILGCLSLIFWALVLIVTVKYVMLVMRADNAGEGGILALMALAQRVAKSAWVRRAVVVCGIAGACLFFGDGVITPAISVLSAIEGLEVTMPQAGEFVMPASIAVIAALFWVQSGGTQKVGRLFGPVMVVWFALIGTLGALEVAKHPFVLHAVSPLYGIHFCLRHGWLAFLELGAVVLAVTGAEALYADMGHFGARPIRAAWTFFVLPSLALNYFGQGALVIGNRATSENPFFLLGPEWLRLPMVVLATAATVIASQAVISGAYSVAQQCMQLGFLPRMQVRHTSEDERGQIYIGQVNAALAAGVVILVLGFGSSDALASAYGIAVTGTFLCTCLLATVVFRRQFGWPRWAALLVFGGFFVIDTVFFSANALKFLSGGWVPIVIAVVLMIAMFTWKRGRSLMFERWRQDSLPLASFLNRLPQSRTIRVPGVAIFLTGNADFVPAALLHNLKHNKVLHERVIFVTVTTLDTPEAGPLRRAEITELATQIYRLTLRYGFMESPNVPRDLEELGSAIGYAPMQASFFLGREVLVPSLAPRLPRWQLWLFFLMARNAVPATEFFRIPSDRVVELGVRIAI